MCFTFCSFQDSLMLEEPVEVLKGVFKHWTGLTFKGVVSLCYVSFFVIVVFCSNVFLYVSTGYISRTGCTEISHLYSLLNFISFCD